MTILIFPSFLAPEDQQTKESTKDTTEDITESIEKENQALVQDILKPFQQLPPELLETMSQAIKDASKDDQTQETKKKSISIGSTGTDMVTNILIDNSSEELSKDSEIEKNITLIESQSKQTTLTTSTTSKVSIS